MDQQESRKTPELKYMCLDCNFLMEKNEIPKNLICPKCNGNRIITSYGVEETKAFYEKLRKET